MKAWIFVSLVGLRALPVPGGAGELENFAEDTAGNYHGGWTSGSNGGYGFGPWQLTARHGAERSYAGFFIARVEDQADLGHITRRHAFGLYANGVEFEEAVARRPFQKPLRPGEAFSVLLEHGRIRTEGEDDRTSGSLGVILWTGAAEETTREFDCGARFQFIYREGGETYLIWDGESGEREDTGIAITENGIELTLILAEGDRYDLQARILETDELREWTGRRLGGEPGAPVDGVAFFNRNAEPRDVYFEGLQLNRMRPTP